MGVLSLAPMTILVSEVVLGAPTLRRRVQAGVSLTLLTLAATATVAAVWAIVGAFLGLAYGWVFRHVPGPGLLSPNVFFTLLMCLAAPVLPLVVIAVTRRWTWSSIVLGALFAGTFGWLLPYLAQ